MATSSTSGSQPRPASCSVRGLGRQSSRTPTPRIRFPQPRSSERGRAILLKVVWKTLGWVGIHAIAGLLAAALTAPAAGASGLELSMSNGHVTIRAQDALITDILAEWGRVGNTMIIDADELVEQTVTIELVDVPEAKALRTLLRTASGYVAAPRATMSDGVSRFDRILILATSKPAARIAHRGLTRQTGRDPDGQRRTWAAARSRPRRSACPRRSAWPDTVHGEPGTAGAARSAATAATAARCRRG